MAQLFACITFQTRVRVLQAYVNDLSEQNEVLVQTVEELEREANERVEILESKLQKTSGTHKVRRDKNISIMHLSCRTRDLQFSLVLQKRLQ